MSHELNQKEFELERMLSGLRPRTLGLSRDAMMFRAGQCSVRPKLRSYQMATCGLLVALMASTGGLFLHQPDTPAPEPVTRPVPVFVNAGPLPVGPDAEPGPASYAVLRERVLKRGTEELPLPVPLTGRLPRPHSWREPGWPDKPS